MPRFDPAARLPVALCAVAPRALPMLRRIFDGTLRVIPAYRPDEALWWIARGVDLVLCAGVFDAATARRLGRAAGCVERPPAFIQARLAEDDPSCQPVALAADEAQAPAFLDLCALTALHGAVGAEAQFRALALSLLPEAPLLTSRKAESSGRETVQPS